MMSIIIWKYVEICFEANWRAKLILKVRCVIRLHLPQNQFYLHGEEGQQVQLKGQAHLGLDARIVLPQDRISQPQEHHLEPRSQYHPHQSFHWLIRTHRPPLHRHRKVAAILQRPGMELAQKLEYSEYISSPISKSWIIIDQGREHGRLPPFSTQPIRSF